MGGLARDGGIGPSAPAGWGKIVTGVGSAAACTAAGVGKVGEGAALGPGSHGHNRGQLGGMRRV